MPIELTKGAIDFGIVVRDLDAALRFYGDTLGFERAGVTPLPEFGPPGVVHRMLCGESLVKLVRFDDVPHASNPPGGLASATGYRYFTIPVSNLVELVEEVEAAGYSVQVRPMEPRPGITIAMVEDPDGNWVEFIQAG